MTEQSLTDLLERLGNQTTVGAPPVEQMVSRVRRQRRLRAAAVTVAATLTAAVAATGVVAALGGSKTPPAADRGVDPTTAQTPTSASGDTLGPTPLDGTWQVTALVGTNGRSVLPTDAQPIDLVIENGRMTGTTGCNNFTGAPQQYDERERSIIYTTTVTGAPSTPSIVCVAVDTVAERLDVVRHFNRTEENTLTLHAANWMIVFQLDLIAPATNGAPTTATLACLPVAPRELPDGAPAGRSREIVSVTGQETVRQFSWGNGKNTVTQQAGNPLRVPEDLSQAQQAPMRDTTARLIPIGDPGQIAFVFTIEGCTYTNWIGPGIDMVAARDYVTRY
ncbi:META domain-containing protein [Nocardioides sp. T2.26MG-1]|uniref:META domain-containing protein n=1 Tax=Nocardioides sp. T2.26MG-1 TaxID=3041166 RepID=UPI0024778CDF|nr:META domain-containing protein [Nocardioides sp. T2.26MG-1]CAI9418164.1 hypothetical protein HIDPHFAB_03201 [Nocardioides sp. T2.26MG-1]